MDQPSLYSTRFGEIYQMEQEKSRRIRKYGSTEWIKWNLLAQVATGHTMKTSITWFKTNSIGLSELRASQYAACFFSCETHGFASSWYFIRDCEILSQSRAARGWMWVQLIQAHSGAQMWWCRYYDWNGDRPSPMLNVAINHSQI